MMKEQSNHEYWAKAVVIVFTFIISGLIKNINFILNVSGSIFSNTLMFIIAPLLYIVKFKDDIGTTGKTFNILIIFWGILNMLYGLAKNFL